MHRSIGVIFVLCSLFGNTESISSQAAAPINEKVAPSVGLLSRRAVAFNPVSHKLYAVSPRDGMLLVLNGKDHSSISVKVGSDPVAIAVNTITNRIYVANNGGTSISVLNGTTDKVIATLDVGKAPYALAVNEVTNRIYVSNTFSSTLSIIDGPSNAIHTLNVGSADEIRVDPTHDEVYFLGYENDYLTIVNGRDEAVRKVAAGALHLWDMALDNVAKEVYVSRIGSNDLVLLSEHGERLLTLAAGEMPGATGIDSRRKLVYVTNYADSSLSVIDGTKRAGLATLQVGKHPQAVAVDEVAGLVYVANTGGDSISVLDEARMKVIATLPAGKGPYALAIDSEDGVVYAANIGEVALTAIDVSRIQSQARQKH